MIELSLLNDWHKEIVVDDILEAYTPMKQAPPEHDRWTLCETGWVYEIYGYVDGALYHVVVSERPYVEGGCFIFTLEDSTYYIPVTKLSDMRVKKVKVEVWYKIVKRAQDGSPLRFPGNDPTGGGKIIVEYWGKPAVKGNNVKEEVQDENS